VQNEPRAWPLSRGDRVEAAATLHTDTRAVHPRCKLIGNDLAKPVACRGVKAAAGKRSRAKRYVVEDGDVLNIRFTSRCEIGGERALMGASPLHLQQQKPPLQSQFTKGHSLLSSMTSSWTGLVH